MQNLNFAERLPKQKWPTNYHVQSIFGITCRQTTYNARPAGLEPATHGLEILSNCFSPFYTVSQIAGLRGENSLERCATFHRFTAKIEFGVEEGVEERVIRSGNKKARQPDRRRG
jgi:hypothetical protein